MTDDLFLDEDLIFRHLYEWIQFNIDKENLKIRMNIIKIQLEELNKSIEESLGYLHRPWWKFW